MAVAGNDDSVTVWLVLFVLHNGRYSTGQAGPVSVWNTYNRVMTPLSPWRDLNIDIACGGICCALVVCAFFDPLFWSILVLYQQEESVLLCRGQTTPDLGCSRDEEGEGETRVRKVTGCETGLFGVLEGKVRDYTGLQRRRIGGHEIRRRSRRPLCLFSGTREACLSASCRRQRGQCRRDRSGRSWKRPNTGPGWYR